MHLLYPFGPLSQTLSMLTTRAAPARRPIDERMDNPAEPGVPVVVVAGCPVPVVGREAVPEDVVGVTVWLEAPVRVAAHEDDLASSALLVDARKFEQTEEAVTM